MPEAAIALGATGSCPWRNSGVGDAAYMPDLGEDVPSGGMDGGGDGFPCLGLLAGPEAGYVGIADAKGIDGDTFAQDEAGRGALRVVLSDDRGGNVVGGTAQARERGHEDAVGKVEVAELDWVEETVCRCHQALDGLGQAKGAKCVLRVPYLGSRVGGIGMPNNKALCQTGGR